jgi:hypothetical protein
VAPKTGIGEIVEFGPPFLVDMDRENLSKSAICFLPPPLPNTNRLIAIFVGKNRAPLKKLRGGLKSFWNATGYVDVIKEQLIISVTGSKIPSSESLIN